MLGMHCYGFCHIFSSYREGKGAMCMWVYFLRFGKKTKNTIKIKVVLFSLRLFLTSTPEVTLFLCWSREIVHGCSFICVSTTITFSLALHCIFCRFPHFWGTLLQPHWNLCQVLLWACNFLKKSRNMCKNRHYLFHLFEQWNNLQDSVRGNFIW